MLRTAPVWFALLMLVPLHGQTAVEAGLGASRAAIMAAPAQDMGKSLGGLMGGMEKFLQSIQASGKVSGPSAVTVVPPEKMAAPKADGRIYEDPKLIQPGLAYEELLQRFGPPAMELTTGPGRKSLMYAGKDGAATRVELQDGKVLAPDAPKAKPAPAQQSAVIVLK